MSDKLAMEQQLAEIRQLPEVTGIDEVEPCEPLSRKEERDAEFERLYRERDTLYARAAPYSQVQPLNQRIYELNREELEERNESK